MQFSQNFFNSQNSHFDTDKKVYDLYPETFDLQNPNFLILDDKYVATLFAINYNKEMEAAFLDKLLSIELDIQVSIFYEKLNSAEVIKKITYYIGNTRSRSQKF